MNGVLPRTNARAGFALIVVLGTLLVIAALFAVTQIRSMTALKTSGTERRILAQMAQSGDYLRLSIAVLLSDPTRTEFELPWENRIYRLVLQDVGGLIDLNAAHPDLLSRLGNSIGASADGIARFRDWQNDNHQLKTLPDFLRIAEIGATGENWLHQRATVFSGRAGLSPDLAPVAVLEVATGQQGPADQLRSALDKSFASDPSGNNFAVYHVLDGALIYVGTVHVGPTMDESRVLAIR